MKLSVYQAFSVLLVVSHQIRVSAQNSTSKWLKDTTRSVAMEAYAQCNCKCGEANQGPKPKVVGGEPTGVNQYPWMARLTSVNGKDLPCGGSLINDLYVLTAAHCLTGMSASSIKVVFADWDRCKTSAKPMTRLVSQVILGKYNDQTHENDIALLRLKTKVPISTNIKPICLPTVLSNSYTGKVSVVIGWGLMGASTESCVMRHAQVSILSNDICKKKWSNVYYPTVITDNMMCAGDGKKGSCSGDSGGPLVVQRKDKRYEIVGIVSKGKPCGQSESPGVFARVTHYVKWIRANVKEGCWCKN